MGVLERIVAAKREELPALRRRARELREEAEAKPRARPFEAALAGVHGASAEVALIAEVKRRSPSAGWIREGADAAAIAADYEAAGAAAVSVLTEEGSFGGSLGDLRVARGAIGLPVLRKDFVIDPVQLWEARAAEADAALLIVRVLDDAELADLVGLARELGLSPLVEVHDGRELDRALKAGSVVVGMNNRDLETFRTDLRVALELAAEVPPDTLLVAESGIETAEQVDRLGAAGVDAVLVGEHLMRSPDPGAAARRLVGRPAAGVRRTGAGGGAS